MGGPQHIPRPEIWTPGRPAPWAGLDAPSRLILPDRIRSVFPRERSGLPSPVTSLGASQSAVLIPIYDLDGELHVVLTRRSWTLRTHKGEVSFPGGRADPGEDALAAAIREANEEISLDPAIVEPLGELDHLTTISRRAYIVPVVALLSEPPVLQANDAEVDRVLHVPLAELTADGVFREERWGDGPLSRPIYFFDLDGDTVWGATAAMLRQMLARLTDTDPGTPIDMDPARDVPPGIRLPGEDDGVV